jgi:hypothetical protein
MPVRSEAHVDTAGQLLAGDIASTILDHVIDAPCDDTGVICSLRWVLDYLTGSLLLLGVCVVLGFVVAMSMALVTARTENRGAPRPLRKRIVAGPVHTDGAWIRLVEDERGHRMIEVLEGGATWRRSDRDLSHLLLDVPLTLEPRA